MTSQKVDLDNFFWEMLNMGIGILMGVKLA
jgi:hypothetical protein